MNCLMTIRDDLDRRRVVNRIGFDIYDTDRDGILSVLDLIKAKS